MDQEPFQNVGVATQMRAPHATGFIEMRVGTLQPYVPGVRLGRLIVVA